MLRYGAPAPAVRDVKHRRNLLRWLVEVLDTSVHVDTFIENPYTCAVAVTMGLRESGLIPPDATPAGIWGWHVKASELTEEWEQVRAAARAFGEAARHALEEVGVPTPLPVDEGGHIDREALGVDAPPPIMNWRDWKNL